MDNIFLKGETFTKELESFVDSCVESNLLNYDVALEHVEIIQAIRDYLERLKADTKPF